MGEFKEEYLLSRQEYGALFPYLMKDEVYLMFWNGRSLWIEDNTQGRYVAKERLSDAFVNRFAMLMGNRCGVAFNRTSPVLECENEVFYLQMIHESVAGSGTTLLMRKKERPKRPDAKGIVESGFCDESALAFLKETVRDRQSFLIYGTMGSGKLMLLRFMTRYITPESRILTVDGDVPLHIAAINPDKDVTELSYMKRSVRGHLREVCRGIRPGWILGNPSDGETACEILDVMNCQSIRGGLCITADQAGEVAENLFFREDERILTRMGTMLRRRFPVWIGVDPQGISHIEVYEKQKVKTVYKRGYEEV